MGDRKQELEPGAVAFLVDSEAAGILQGALDSMKLGPGKPGPGDEWKVPLGPVDEVAFQNGEADEPVGRRDGGLLHRLIHRG